MDQAQFAKTSPELLEQCMLDVQALVRAIPEPVPPVARAAAERLQENVYGMVQAFQPHMGQPWEYDFTGEAVSVKEMLDQFG